MRPHELVCGCAGWLVVSVVTAGCVGFVAEPPSSDTKEDPQVVNPRDPSETLPAFQPPATGLRRLTVTQYANTVRDLLGEDVDVAGTILPDADSEGSFEFSDVLASTATSSELAIEKYEIAADQAAATAFGSPARLQTTVGCAPESAADPCVEDFLSRFLRRAFRRPATTEELDRYLQFVATAEAELQDMSTAIRYAVSAVLQSPSFLYRSELGHDGRLDDYELASRLSYFVWDSTPDDLLLDAAERGELGTDEGLRAQARRLLESPRAEGPLGRFFSEWLSLEALDRIPKNDQVFPEFGSSTGAAMRQELEELFAQIVLVEDGSFLSLLNSDRTFVNEELARLYGIEMAASSEFVEISLPPQRRGLLTSAGVLSLFALPIDTSPTRRGLFVRERILCDEIPPPPPGAEAILPEPMPGEMLTNRQRVERHMFDDACKGCHSKIDPLGLPLEHFDGMGRYRETDRGMPLDVTGDLNGTAFDGATELADMLASNQQVQDCFVRHAYRHALGQHEEPEQFVSIYELSDAWSETGLSLRSLVEAIVMSQAFRTAGEPQ